MSRNKPSHQKQLLEAQEREEKTAKSGKQKAPLNFTPHTPTKDELSLYDKAVFTWIAPEYIQHPKSRVWYIAAAIIAGIVVIVDIFTADFTMALAVIVLAVVYMYVHSHHPPKEIKITISKMGIKVGKMVFPYSSIRAFWIFYNPPHISTLNLRVKEHFFSDVIIQLNHEDPVPIREFLCGQIPEWEGKHESFSDLVLRLLKL